MSKQMPEGYRIFRIFTLDLEIQIFADRIVQFELALLHQLKQSDG